ncbi:class I SAM-dependent methyltransferase [Streptomyces niveus]|uniref:class I SAM-dependent methyltransferase n=1 Tax=Streptomyces niveus TaxID=193462 RepID=UPI0009904361|nr:methyltransferase domain-containing protein [Streptomyces niveus]
MTLLHDAELSAAFDHAALAYDRLVAVNPGYHAHLRRSARRLGPPRGGAGLRLLDLGCGTGASTAALLAAAPHAEIVAVDASAGMLERAAAKSWPAGVSFVHAPVERLGEAGVTGPFDGAFAAYLFRNLTDPDRALALVRSLLAPGGRIGVHEYALGGVRKVAPSARRAGPAASGAVYRKAEDRCCGWTSRTRPTPTTQGAPPVPPRGLRGRGAVPGVAGQAGLCGHALGGRAVDRAVWTAVCKGVVLPAGRLAGDADLYRHLWRSVVEFDAAPAFGDRLRRAGFGSVRVLPMPGWQTGIAHTFVGRRAAESGDAR